MRDDPTPRGERQRIDSPESGYGSTYTTMPTDRIVKDYSVTETELKMLSRATQQLVGLVSVGMLFLAIAVDCLLDGWFNSTPGATTAGIALLVASLTLLIFGYFQQRQRKSIIQEIRETATERKLRR